jgi:signal transduction histidine kinase
LIEETSIDRRPIDNETFQSAIRNPQSAITLNSSQNNLEIQYTGLSFISSGQVKFKYKLEGLETDWNEVGTRRAAYYSYLPAGEYTFHVIAANRDGVWNMEGASIKVKVLPPFYRTWWFIALAVFCVLGLGFLIFKARINQIEKERKAQEEFSRRLLASQEQERQRIAAELHDSLGQSLLIIKNRIVLAQSDIDEKEVVEEQLDELSHSASSAIEECREIAYNLRPYQINRFGLSKTLYGIFMRISEVTNINASTEIDTIDDLLTDEAQINVYRIVQECVNNIIKHSDATEAMLVIKRNENDVTLLIQDNGRGFVQSKFATSENKRSGFGLIGIAERVKMLGGSCEIDSTQGTSIKIKI